MLRFTAIRGIGPWTAQYIAMRALKLPDALRWAMSACCGRWRPAPGVRAAAALLARAEAWRPYRPTRRSTSGRRTRRL